jgi:ankyrin repeat protein
MAASRNDRESVARLLLDNGPDINASNNIGKTASAAASFRGNISIIQLLLDNGAVVNAAHRAIKDASESGYGSAV